MIEPIWQFMRDNRLSSRGKSCLSAGKSGASVLINESQHEASARGSGSAAILSPDAPGACRRAPYGEARRVDLLERLRFLVFG